MVGEPPTQQASKGRSLQLHGHDVTPLRRQEQSTSRGVPPQDTSPRGSRGVPGVPGDQGRSDAEGDPCTSSRGTLGPSHRHVGPCTHESSGEVKRHVFRSVRLQSEREASLRRLHRQLVPRTTSLPDLRSLCQRGLQLNGGVGLGHQSVSTAVGCQGQGFDSRSRHGHESDCQDLFCPQSFEGDDTSSRGLPTPFAEYRTQPRWSRPREPGGSVVGGLADLESPLRFAGPPGFVLPSLAGEAPLTPARSGAVLSTISSRELSSMESARYSDNPFM